MEEGKREGGRGDTGQRRRRLTGPAAHLHTAGQSAPQPRNERICASASVRALTSAPIS